MTKIAVVQKCPATRPYDWAKTLGAEVTDFYLCDYTIDKLTKEDISLEKSALDSFDLVITVGAEPTKFLAKKMGAVTEYQGSLFDGKFVPIITPGMLYFKPHLRSGFDAAIDRIKKYISGEMILVSDDYKGIESYDEAVEYIKELFKYKNIAVDTEGTALYPRDGYVLGVSLSTTLERGRYISHEIIYGEVYSLMQELFSTKRVVMHNSKYDLSMMEYHFGFRFIKDINNPLCVEDTMLLHYILDENNGHGLKELALKYTNLGNYEQALDDYKKEYCRKFKIKQDDFTYDLIPFDVISVYAAQDTSATIALYDLFAPKVYANSKLLWAYKNLLMRGTFFLEAIQENGVPFNKEELEVATKVLVEKYELTRQKLYQYPEVLKFEQDTGVKFNPNSVMQLRVLLFDYLKLPVSGKLTGTGADSTDAEVLEELSQYHDVPKIIVDMKKAAKLLSTYIVKAQNNLNRDGKLRTNFNLHTTTSGRLSSSGKLNLQQLPRDDKTVKKCIKAKPGYKIVSCDLQTAEMYYAAVLSGDENLQEVFRTGGDFHTEVAVMVFELYVPEDVEDRKEYVTVNYPGKRQQAKSISFGILYGAGPEKIAQQANCTLTIAKDSITQYFRKFNKLRKWLDNQAEFISKNGYIYSAFGRKRRLLNIFGSDKGLKSHDVRSGINFLIQSVASDANLLGAMDAYDELEVRNIDASIFALVHDSIVAEVREDQVDKYISIVRMCLERDRGVSIPGKPIGVDFGYGESYADT